MLATVNGWCTANAHSADTKQVLRYLARYPHRVAISNRRLIACDDKGVTFKWKDYRIEGRQLYKRMTLATDAFIRRFLIHVLPGGFHRIRHYGLFANGFRADNIAQARKLLAVPTPKRKADQAADANRANGSLASMSMLRWTHDHHRDLRTRLNTSISANATNRDQDRQIMIRGSCNYRATAALAHLSVLPCSRPPWQPLFFMAKAFMRMTQHSRSTILSSRRNGAP